MSVLENENNLLEEKQLKKQETIKNLLKKTERFDKECGYDTEVKRNERENKQIHSECKTRGKKFKSSSDFICCILYGEDFSCIIRRSIHQQALENTEVVQEDSVPSQDENVELPFAVGRTDKKCNIFEGKWVYDEAARPLYQEDECPYIQPQLQCLKYGRPDIGYQHWRWQPHGCNLPSVNATFMLDMLRNKRMLFAGDSLNRGQFVSMVCILHRAIPEERKSFKSIDSLTIFSAMDYNATIEFYWAPFLVESNSDNAIVHRVTDRIVRGRSINKHAKHWKGADIIVFSSYLWWMTGVPMKILTGPFSGDMTNIELMKTDDAYRVAMTRMVRWVEKNMDPNTTRVFFTTMSPTHEKSKEWGGEQNGNCYNETTPIEDPTYWGGGSRKSVMKVLKQVLDKSKVPFTVVNITQMSEYRKDGHTAIYKKQWNKLTEQQLAEPTSYADCVHWCLPGVQDTWNELLYSKLFYP